LIKLPVFYYYLVFTTGETLSCLFFVEIKRLVGPYIAVS